GRSQLCWLRHEIFAEQVRVLNHCPLERLENDAAPFQLIRNHVALDKFVTCEDHAPGYLFESARLLENRCALLLSWCTTVIKPAQVEEIDISESPRLIFSCRRG